ncbi:helix-turn-helix transcriptional regulator [Psychromonas aquatilis]|uniref:AlpA family phage regulatory protein n=1 Tax=Psychromonas aquatilis TaxID=2005072 RepID=A0ABU9GSV8_9GAMM
MITNTTSFTESNRVISITELSQLLSKSRVSLWRWQRDGVLPLPIKIQGRTIGWRESAILEWLESQEVS